MSDVNSKIREEELGAFLNEYVSLIGFLILILTIAFPPLSTATAELLTLPPIENGPCGGEDENVTDLNNNPIPGFESGPENCWTGEDLPVNPFGTRSTGI